MVCSHRPATGCVLLLVLLASMPAHAEDSERRKPGERAKRPASPAHVIPLAPAPPPLEGERRRPGEAAEVDAPSEVQVEGTSGTDDGDPDDRRRPDQSEAARPDAAGERLRSGDPGTRPRQPFEINRGLAPLEKPPADAVYAQQMVADRWQLTRALGLTDFPWYDPYNQNTLKADRPVWGQWFFNLGLVSDTVVEPRRLPTPVAPQGEAGPGNSDLIGDGDQLLFAHNLALQLVYYRGNTTFMPPDWEFRFTPVLNINRADVGQYRALRIDPTKGDTRHDKHIGVQDLFIDKHLRDVTARYDFDSLRVGIQPFNADFRGFLFRDEQLGIRLFGNRDNNHFLYNLGWFRRLEKDTNSGLNDLGEPLRRDDVFVANLYWQDVLALGFTNEFIALYNVNREGKRPSYFNKNGFIERPFSFGLEKPRNYEVLYLGLAGEGHIGRLNLSATTYWALGEQDRGVFVDRPTDIRALFMAAELSWDFDWRRVRINLLYASGDDDPFDDVETGFDAVFENPLFAGADTSFWVRQNVPLIGGGGVAIAGRNGVLNSLRSSKEQGQSNFTNPGTVIAGVGADLDVTPALRISGNLNYIGFATPEVVRVARQQADVSRDLGTDVSMAAIWRPYMSQNVVLRASAAALLPGSGYRALFGDDTAYSVLFNLTLTY